MLLIHCYSSDCWQLSGLLPDGGGQKSTEQSPASTLVTILIVFIWLYSVLFVVIPLMGWRDVPCADPLFLKVFKFVGFLTPGLLFTYKFPEVLSTVYYHQLYSYQDLWHCT